MFWSSRAMCSMGNVSPQTHPTRTILPRSPIYERRSRLHGKERVQRVRTGEPVTTVLVVDDDSALRKLVRDILEQDGIQVLEEPRGERVVALVAAGGFDAVVLDKELPGLNGLEVLSRLRHRCPEVPVILVTAFGGSDAAAEAFRRGATRYLEKPFRLVHLLTVIRNLTWR
jgi:DNA-binding NtrC family response regulator